MEHYKREDSRLTLNSGASITKIALGVFTIVVFFLGGVGSYMSDKAAIHRNKDAIQRTIAHINKLEASTRAKDEKQVDTMNQILIKVTRLEALISK